MKKYFGFAKRKSTRLRSSARHPSTEVQTSLFNTPSPKNSKLDSQEPQQSSEDSSHTEEAPETEIVEVVVKPKPQRKTAGGKKKKTKQNTQETSMADISQKIDKLQAFLEKTIKETEQKIEGRLTRIESKIDDNSKEIRDIKERQLTLEKELKHQRESIKTQERKQELTDEKFDLQDIINRENNLRIRGINEQFGSDTLREDLQDLLHIHFELEKELVQIERAFRINSRVARVQKLPRDIIVKLSHQRAKDEILQLQRNKPLKIDGEMIQIFSDLPPAVLQKRRQFDEFRRFLHEKEIRFKWIPPYYLSVSTSFGRRLIKTKEEAENLMEEILFRTSPTRYRRERTEREKKKEHKEYKEQITVSPSAKTGEERQSSAQQFRQRISGIVQELSTALNYTPPAEQEEVGNLPGPAYPTPSPGTILALREDTGFLLSRFEAQEDLLPTPQIPQTPILPGSEDSERDKLDEAAAF